jgi:hypothetical protein
MRVLKRLSKFRTPPPVKFIANGLSDKRTATLSLAVYAFNEVGAESNSYSCHG